MLLEHSLCRTGLHDHHRHRVRDHVVELARDSRPLFCDGRNSFGFESLPFVRQTSGKLRPRRNHASRRPRGAGDQQAEEEIAHSDRRIPVAVERHHGAGNRHRSQAGNCPAQRFVRGHRIEADHEHEERHDRLINRHAQEHLDRQRQGRNPHRHRGQPASPRKCQSRRDLGDRGRPARMDTGVQV